MYEYITPMVDPVEQSKALASEARLSILQWLSAPERHFAHQITGAPEEIGVCVTLIAKKLGMAQPTASRHLEVLRRAGFLSPTKIGRWSFYRRDEDAILAYKEWLNDRL